MPNNEIQQSQEQALTGGTRSNQAERGERTREGRSSSNELRRAVANPRGASPETLLNLQRTYGNQAVQRLLQTAPPAVQRFKWNPFKKNSPAKKEENLNVLLSNKGFFQQFYLFCVKEYSTENIECWADVDAYKGSPNMPRAKRIYNQFFASEKSANGVNIPNKARVEITEALNDAKTDGIGDRATASTLFDNVMKDVMMNLTDSYSRFKFTPEYAQWRKVNPDV